jgi:DNA-binding CsgD family transcriptional regulator
MGHIGRLPGSFPLRSLRIRIGSDSRVPLAVTRPIVEREREFAALDRCLALAQGGAGQLLVLEGAAGIGKTLLLAEACARAARRGFRVLAARGSELEREFAFGVVRQLLEPPLAKATREEREAMLAGAARLCESLFDSTGESAERPDPDLGLRRLHGLYWLCANLAGEGPLVVSVDDVHWSDVSSLGFLAYLAARLDGLPLLVVAAVRHGEPGVEAELLRRIAAEPGASVLRPAPLSEQGIAVLAADLFGGAVESGFAATCRHATGGIPFLVWELMRSLETDGGPPTAAAAARIVELGPKQVARSVELRVSRQSSSARQLCSAVAVLGGEADLRRAAALAGLELETALADVDALSAAGLLAPARGGAVRFVHPIVHAAVYADLPAAERERGHEAAARLLLAERRPTQEVAAHLMRLHPRGEDWIADTLLAAGLEATARGAPDAATPLLRRALEEAPPDRSRTQVLLALGAAEARLGRPAAVEHLTAAIEDITDPRTLAAATSDLTLALGFSGRMTDALSALNRTIEVIAPQDRELALALEAILGASSKLADYHEPLSPRWDRYGEIKGDTPGERILLGERAWERAFAGGTADEVAGLVELALSDGAEAILVRQSAHPPFFQATYLLAICDRFDQSEAALQAALTAGRSLASLWMIATAEHWLAHLALRRGRVAKAAAHAHASIEFGTIVGWKDALEAMHAILARALIERGALAEAEQELNLTLAAEHMPTVMTSTLAFEARADLRIAQGDPEAALRDIYAIRDRETGRRAGNPASLPWRSQAASALLMIGDREQANVLAEDEAVLARGFGAPRAIGIALRVSGLATKGSDGIARLREAVEVLSDSGARLEHARALTDLGAAIRRSGSRVQAREPLRHGLELAHACGATALAERAHTELLASGARPRRLTFSGADSLTASERRVAELAAAGMGNVAIAQALFVSRKTIETHLGHVFDKLNITSRDHLGPLLDAVTTDDARDETVAP